MADDFYCDQVLNGRLKVDTVAETDHVLAFHHTKPSWPVHIVIIPKLHVDSLVELVDHHGSLVVEMMEVLVEVVRKVTRDHGGCRLTTNFGKFQSSNHLHWHIYVGDDR